MMRQLLLLSSVFALALCASTDLAMAQQACKGRPGASAIEQYCEAIPDGTGSRETPGGGRNSRGGAGQTPAGTRGDLQSSGADGAAVLALLAAGNSSSGGNGSGRGGSAPGGKTGGSGGGATGSPSGGQIESAETPGDNPLRAIASAVSTGATVGTAFIWGLLGVALIALIVAWFGFRSRHRLP